MSATPPEPPDSLAGATMVLQVTQGGPFRLKVVEARDESLVGTEFSLDKGCLIGRADECEVVVKDTSVSRKHARIEWTGLAWRLLDLKSANGTWVGDHRVEGTLLAHLDRFRVGNTVLEFAREGDTEADDLKMAMTTSVPIKEVLESIRLQLSVSLDEEGEEIVVAGNRPFFLADPEALWLIVDGKLDVFTVAMKDGEPAGVRSHFLTVEKGAALFGMDLEGYGLGSGFLVSGRTGVRLRKIGLPRLAEIAAAGKHVQQIAGLVDGWVAALGKALVRDMPAQAVEVDLDLGQEATLELGKRARARKEVAWVSGEGFLFVSLSEVSAGDRPLLFPVGGDAWIESAEDGTTLTPKAAAASLGDPAFWRGLGVFHQVLCECEFINKKLATVDEYNRLRSKAEYAEAAKASAMRDIGDVLARTVKKKETIEVGDVEPVYQACRFICAELGMEAKKPPEARAERGFEEALYAVSVSSRFRTRQVALRGDWWNHDQGPLLGKLESTKEPVPLIPTSPTSYHWVDIKTGKKGSVNAEMAATLDPFAYAFYRRFQDGVLAAKQVAKFGARGLKPDFIWLIGMGIALGVLGSMTPYFTGRMFDSAIPQAERGLLFQFSFALFVSAIASSAFKLTQSVAVLRVQGKMDYAIQAALWDRLLDLPSTFFRQYAAGDLADRAGGVDQIRQLLAGAGIGAILGSLSSVFYVVLMLQYSVPLALLGIGLTLLFIAFTTTANFLQLRAQRTQMTMNGKITGLVLQLISGVGKLRVSGAEHHGFRVWAKEFAQQKRIGIKAGLIQNAVAVFNASYPILTSMAIFATLVYVQNKAAAAGGGAEAGITTGDFIAFNAAFGLFLAAMQALSEASLSLLKAVPIWERLAPILSTPPEIDDSKAAPGTLKGEIEVSHVSFRYGEDSPYILRDLSIKIRPGEFIAFVGGSGCGKSTLMRLMLGFEKPEKGTIYFDGQDLSTLDLRLVRQQLGVVLQDSRVLPADIFRNIVGTTSRSIDEAWEAAEAAGFADDIRQMPMGMHTYVSEGGGGFSGGQKQRLMISRSVVNKPKILFLDEATSALDNKTQNIVTQSMDRMRSTRIVIAHRLSTIVNANRICYLQGGQIAEMGTYDELMKKDGLFAELARRQMV